MEKYLNINRKWQIRGLSPTEKGKPSRASPAMLTASCMRNSHDSKSMSGYVSDPKEDLKNRS